MENEKTIKDLVPARCWYYLLEFNDRDDCKTIEERYKTKKLSNLSLEQFWSLFKYATENDFKIFGENK